MRHVIRQARVCVITKLIREAKRLRSKHGNEQQQEKYKNKADRLISEIHTLKTIKDDAISKFGIINEKDLNDILQDQSLNESTRVTARVAHYKPLHKRFVLFREKFPYYKKHLNERKKKITKVKSKNVSQVKKSSKEQNHQNLKNENSKKRKINDSNKNIKNSACDASDKEICKTELSKVGNNLCKFENLEKQILTKPEKDNILENVVANKQSDIFKPHSVSKEATVKKFTELLEEQDSDKDTRIFVKDINPINTSIVSERTVDDFFVTENDQNYEESSTNPSTLFSKSHRNNIVTEAFRSNNKIQKQNSKYKNKKNLKKTGRYNELKDKLKSDNVNVNNKQSFPIRQERTCNRINKMMRKSNTDDTSNKEDIALHPSWMAKKKQQEMMSQGFQGKKILFTDE